MGVFRRAQDTRTSAARRSASASLVEVAEDAATLETTAERPIAAPAGRAKVPTTAPSRARAALPDLGATFAQGIDDAPFDDELPEGADAGCEDSDVFVCRKSRPADLEAAARLDAAAVAAAAQGVTLFVYGWHQVQPGPLSWVFPSVRAALDAVRTMRNAVEWCICSGEAWADVDSARASGAVLIEQLG